MPPKKPYGQFERVIAPVAAKSAVSPRTSTRTSIVSRCHAGTWVLGIGAEAKRSVLGRFSHV